MSAGASSWIIGIIAAVVALLVGGLWLFMVIIGLNGFSERQATPMLLATVVLIVANIVFSAAVSPWLARMAQSRAEITPWVAGPLGIIGATIVGGGLMVLISLIAIAILSSR